MLIKKESNGNVIIYADSGAINSKVLLNEYPYVVTWGYSQIKISGYEQPIEVSEIFLDSGGGAIPWTGTRDELIEELSTNFFF